MLCITTPVKIIVPGINFTCENGNSSLYEKMQNLPVPLLSHQIQNIHMCNNQRIDDVWINLDIEDGVIEETNCQIKNSWMGQSGRR